MQVWSNEEIIQRIIELEGKVKEHDTLLEEVDTDIEDHELRLTALEETV